MRALPQELGASVPAPHADVGIEVEHRVFGELAVPVDERGRMAKLAECPPDRLVDAERVRVLHERREEQIERFLRVASMDQVTRKRQACAPVLRILFDEPAAQAGESFRTPGSLRERVKAIEGK